MITILALLVSLTAAVLIPAAQPASTPQPARAAVQGGRHRQPGRVITAPSRPRRVLRPSGVLASRTLHAVLLGAALLGHGLVGFGGSGAGQTGPQASVSPSGGLTARVSGRPGLERAPMLAAERPWS